MDRESSSGNRRSVSLKLDGYSGYHVCLKGDEGDGYTVIKKSSEEGRNQRLQKQYEKHTFFYNLGGKCFGVPRIIGSGYKDGLFFYEYEFVEGVSLIKKIEASGPDGLAELSDKILETIGYFKSKKEVYYEKEAEGDLKRYVVKKIDENSAKCGIDKDIRQALLENLNGFEEGGRYLCHGDFTFDNIIVDDAGKLWLIDYLDVFPHYWLDISKLFQDIDGNWFEIKHNISLPRNKLLFMRKYLLDRIAESEPSYPKHHNFLVAVAFLRVLPYAQSANDRDLIMNKIRYFANSIGGV